MIINHGHVGGGFSIGAVGVQIFKKHWTFAKVFQLTDLMNIEIFLIFLKNLITLGIVNSKGNDFQLGI
jgi:hypothetical protein